MKENQAFTIRAAKSNDARVCQILRKSGWQDNYVYPEGGITKDVLVNELAKTPPSEEDMKYFVSNLEKEENKNNVLVAELHSNGQIIGVVFYECLPDGGGDIGVFVDREYRGQGVGSAILEKLVGQTSNNLEVTVFAQNQSRDLYKKYGFKELGGQSMHRFDSTKYLPVQKLILKRA